MFETNVKVNVVSVYLLRFRFKKHNFKIQKMPGHDLISEQGLRLDGRRANELRRIRCKLGVFSQPDGSAYLEQGNTKVLAAVYGPHQVKFYCSKRLLE